MRSVPNAARVCSNPNNAASKPILLFLSLLVTKTSSGSSPDRAMARPTSFSFP